MFWDNETSRKKAKYNWLPDWARIQSEAVVHPHVPEERAELFDGHNTGTTELEVLNWLHATVRVLKPEAILETGAANGLGTIALANACKRNGLGVVHSVEIDLKLCEELNLKLKKEGLREYVQIHCQDSREFLLDNSVVFDLGFFDSMCEFRAQEFTICLQKGTIRNLAVFHDTSALRCLSLKGWPSDDLHLKYRNDLKAFRADPRCSGFFESKLSRGFICLFVNSDPVPADNNKQEKTLKDTETLAVGGKREFA